MIKTGEKLPDETLFEFNPSPMGQIKTYLDTVSEQWDETLSHLKSFVEEE